MSKNNDELFGEAGKVNFKYFTFEKPGDKVKGVYVGKYRSVSSKFGYEQENYILVQDDGEKILVSGRNATKNSPVRIIYGMEKIPLGAIMGFIYTGDKDTGKGNPCKIIEPRYLGEKDMETYNKFKEMYSLEEIASNAEETAKDIEETEEPNPEF